MTPERERATSAAFVSLARSLVDGFDVVELLTRFTIDCSRLLDIECAGLLLADSRGVLHLMAASSEQARSMELFQLQSREGPCLDCFTTAAPVAAEDLSAEGERWPTFAPVAQAAGFGAVHAVPMRLREQVIGALGLFKAQTGSLSIEDLALAQALADVATIAIIAHKISSDNAVIAEQLQTALTSRVVLEQAKGLLAQLGDLTMEQSFTALRTYARDHNQRLSVVAQNVVSRTLPAREILDHANSRGLLARSPSELGHS